MTRFNGPAKWKRPASWCEMSVLANQSRLASEGAGSKRERTWPAYVKKPRVNCFTAPATWLIGGADRIFTAPMTVLFRHG